VHYGIEEITVNVRKMLKKFYWTYLLIWRSLTVALNTLIILKYVQLISKLSSTPQKSRSRFITDFSTCKDAFLKFERQIFYIG
jgi:hypothetical protein